MLASISRDAYTPLLQCSVTPWVIFSLEPPFFTVPLLQALSRCPLDPVTIVPEGKEAQASPNRWRRSTRRSKSRVELC